MALGAPNLEEIYDLRPNGSWSRKMVESSAEKTIEITLRRWPGPFNSVNMGNMGNMGYMGMGMGNMGMSTWDAKAPWGAAVAAARYNQGLAPNSANPAQATLDDQASQRLARLENALLALKPQIETMVAVQSKLTQASTNCPTGGTSPRNEPDQPELRARRGVDKLQIITAPGETKAQPRTQPQPQPSHKRRTTRRRK
ncbi:unnamed protein product [Effrenium voratum]|nr:unnamed protein product [Effrenium voratum]